MSNVNGFTDEDDIKLIKLIRINHVLYDVNHTFHKDIAFKDHTWTGISVGIGKSVSQCRRRWKNIKAFYLKSKSSTENGLSTANNNWSFFPHLSFLDEYRCERKITSSVQNGEVQRELRDQIIVDEKCLQDDTLVEMPSSTSAENDIQSKEDKIAATLADGLKERNEILYKSLQKQIEILDNTSFTVKIQYETGETSNVQNRESKNKRGGRITGETAVGGELILAPQLSSDTVSSYLTEKLAQSKERNTMLHNLLQKQVDMLENKSENSKSLDLFFKSVLLDVQDFCPRAIDEVKPRVLKSVSEVRKKYYDLNALPDNHSRPLVEQCSSLENRQIMLSNLQKQFDMFNTKLGNPKTMELFFKSVSADIEDFCIRAIDDVKIKILESVSEVKDMYSLPDDSSVTSSINGNFTSNYAPPHTSSIEHNNEPGSSPHGIITFINLPIYCDEPGDYVNEYY